MPVSLGTGDSGSAPAGLQQGHDPARRVEGGEPVAHRDVQDVVGRAGPERAAVIYCSRATRAPPRRRPHRSDEGRARARTRAALEPT